VAFYLQIYFQLCSFNLVLIFTKILRYLAEWFERVKVLFNTLDFAKSEIFYFLLMYLLIFFAFVTMAHLFFGSNLESFYQIGTSIRTLFVFNLGELTYIDDMIALD
jgi:hypothetical protein